MGGDRKLKKRRASSPSSESEGRGRRRRISETKPDSSKSHKNHKSRKSSTHHSDKEMKMEEKHKHKRRHHKHQHRVISDFKELSGADYFSKNNEFATWLKEERDVFFSDLSAESARNLFSEFVKDWNKQRLETRYYEGIVTGPRSSHNWNIKVEGKGV